jgi:hypothetical protein
MKDHNTEEEKLRALSFRIGEYFEDLESVDISETSHDGKVRYTFTNSFMDALDGDVTGYVHIDEELLDQSPLSLVATDSSPSPEANASFEGSLGSKLQTRFGRLIRYSARDAEYNVSKVTVKPLEEQTTEEELVIECQVHVSIHPERPR